MNSKLPVAQIKQNFILVAEPILELVWNALFVSFKWTT